MLICGDRNWKDPSLIREKIMEFNPDVIIEGEARGADSIARDVGQQLIIRVLKFPANWEEYGKAAGVIRNQQMLDEGNPDMVMAFHDDIASSKGTKDMIKRSLKRGVKVILISHIYEMEGDDILGIL